MDYNDFPLEDLEDMLDTVVEEFTNGGMQHSVYTILFNELFNAITRKKDVPVGETPEKAYKRAMGGL